MAKTSWIERNNRKAATVKKYAALRAELKAKRDYAALSKLPKDASPVRVVNRCSMSGRRHGYLRKFGCSLDRYPSGSWRNGRRSSVHLRGSNDRSSSTEKEYRRRIALLHLVGRILLCHALENNPSQSRRK